MKSVCRQILVTYALSIKARKQDYKTIPPQYLIKCAESSRISNVLSKTIAPFDNLSDLFWKMDAMDKSLPFSHFEFPLGEAVKFAIYHILAVHNVPIINEDRLVIKAEHAG